MRPGHGGHIDRFAVLIVLLAAIALVVSEAVLDANDDPAADQRGLTARISSIEGWGDIPQVGEDDTETQGNEEQEG